MNGSPTFPKLSEQSLDEHAVIHFHLDQLERALREFEPAGAAENGLRDLAVRIDSFKERLDEHFGVEEEGGLLQGVLDALPQAESDVRRIKAAHGRIGAALDEARRIARGGDASDAAARKSQLESLIATIREHEREEDELVRRAIHRA